MNLVPGNADRLVQELSQLTGADFSFAEGEAVLRARVLDTPTARYHIGETVARLFGRERIAEILSVMPGGEGQADFILKPFAVRLSTNPQHSPCDILQQRMAAEQQRRAQCEQALEAIRFFTHYSGLWQFNGVELINCSRGALNALTRSREKLQPRDTNKIGQQLKELQKAGLIGQHRKTTLADAAVICVDHIVDGARLNEGYENDLGVLNERARGNQNDPDSWAASNFMRLREHARRLDEAAICDNPEDETSPPVRHIVKLPLTRAEIDEKRRLAKQQRQQQLKARSMGAMRR